MLNRAKFGGYLVALALIAAACSSSSDEAIDNESTATTAAVESSTSVPEDSETKEADDSSAETLSINLPEGGEYPEGIAIDGDTVYVTSFTTGDIFSGSIDDEELRLFVEGSEGDSAVGIVAEGDRIYVAEGANKNVTVYDLDGERIATVSSEAAAFLNDLTVVDGQVYVTDSQAPTIWRFPADITEDATLEAWSDVSESVEYVEGFNLNGIRPGPEGTLVTTNFATGALYTINLESGDATEVELTGGELMNGDGFVGEGDTLWLVRGTSPVVTKIEFESAEAATITIGEPDESLGFPTTGAFDEAGNLWVVNSQFDKGGPIGEGTPDLPFTISTTPAP